MKRYELRAFSRGFRCTIDVENRLSSYKTTEVHITRELAPIPAKAAADAHSNIEVGEVEAIGRGYDQYTVTIASDPVPRPALISTPSGDACPSRQYSVALEANTAAWGYTKIAILFFVSLLVTWVSADMSRPSVVA